MVMAEAVSDLTDAKIEALLSAAEVSLANNIPAVKNVAVKDQQEDLIATATAPATTTTSEIDSKAGKYAVKRSDELSLRVPQLRVKHKKVCQPEPFTFRLSYEENKSQIYMTQEDPPLWW